MHSFWEWPDHGYVILDLFTDWFCIALGADDGCTKEGSPILGVDGSNKYVWCLVDHTGKEGNLSASCLPHHELSLLCTCPSVIAPCLGISYI